MLRHRYNSRLAKFIKWMTCGNITCFILFGIKYHSHLNLGNSAKWGCFLWGDGATWGGKDNG